MLPPAQVPDLQTGFEFRERIYEYMNLTLPEKPPEKVLFWLRTPRLPRELMNTDELVSVVESYNLSYTCVELQRAHAAVFVCPSVCG